jgi:hypothetical protein
VWGRRPDLSAGSFIFEKKKMRRYLTSFSLCFLCTHLHSYFFIFVDHTHFGFERWSHISQLMTSYPVSECSFV